MIENEAIFRQHNEKVQKNFDELENIAKEDGKEHLIEELVIPLEFYCECSDENCHERIKLKLSEHSEIHKNRRAFIIKPGHEVASIEKVIKKMSGYFIVEKFVKPTERPGTLNTTSVDNS